MKTILILATLDTKSEEAAILQSYIEENKCRAYILDCSLRAGGFEKDNTFRKEMLKAANITEKELGALSKNKALMKMTEMAREKLLALYNNNLVSGAIGIGGVQGTLISTGAMQALPIGVPKVVISAVANGNATFGPLVGLSDMLIMHSVVDIAGKNYILKNIMSNAAAAVCGMVKKEKREDEASKMIGLTMGGVTTKCGNYIKEMLEKKGYDVAVFHCNGIGAMAMENLAGEGALSGIIDLTPHDVTDYLFGGMMPALDQRYQVLKEVKIPTIIIPGCADIILFNGMSNVPLKLSERKMIEHNKIHTHVKANYEEMYQVGKFIASHAGEFPGDTAIIIPQKGYSQKNYPGGPLYEPESDQGFADAVAEYESGKMYLEIVPLHINDFGFAKLCVEEMVNLIEK